MRRSCNNTGELIRLRSRLKSDHSLTTSRRRHADTRSRIAGDRMGPSIALGWSRSETRLARSSGALSLGDCDVGHNMGPSSDLGNRLCRRSNVAICLVDQPDVGALYAAKAQLRREATAEQPDENSAALAGSAGRASHAAQIPRAQRLGRADFIDLFVRGHPDLWLVPTGKDRRDIQRPLHANQRPRGHRRRR